MDVSRSSFIFPAAHPAPNASFGFSLIEALVTLLVTTVGLLGLASLQLQGLKGAHEAILRTQAVVFAVDMAELLHAGSNTATNLSTHDIDDWRARIRQRLPGGSGRIESNTTFTSIQVLWNEHGTPSKFSLDVTP